jgi:alkyl sulfatase BDS1-like metallo-beta-lactamase superfamily hydrolase
MSTELFLNVLGIKMDSRRAEGPAFTMNLVTPDTGETFLIKLSNATLNNLPGYRSDDADLTLTIDRAELERVMAGEATLESMLADGTAEGDVAILRRLAELMEAFDLRFEIMPGTKLGAELVDANPYKAVVGAVIPE